MDHILKSSSTRSALKRDANQIFKITSSELGELFNQKDDLQVRGARLNDHGRVKGVIYKV